MPAFYGFSKLAKNLYDCSSIHCELFGTRFCGSTVPRKCSNRLLKNPAPIVATKCPKMAKNGTYDGQIQSGLLLFDFSPSKTWEWTPIKMFFEKIDFFVKLIQQPDRLILGFRHKQFNLPCNCTPAPCIPLPPIIELYIPYRHRGLLLTYYYCL